MVRKIKIGMVLSIFFLSTGVYAGTGSLVACACAAVALSVLFAMACGAFLLVNRLVRNTNRYQNLFRDTDKFINGTKYRTDPTRNYAIANVGSSSGVFSFDYENSGVKGCNWAMAPESLAYNFRVLKNYFSLLKENGTILFIMTPFGFCLRDYDDDLANAKYYWYLAPELILGYSHWKHYTLKKYPLLYSPALALRWLLRDVPTDNRWPSTMNPMTPGELEADAVRWVENWKRQFSISDLEAPVSKSNLKNMTYNTDLLAEMIDFCLERHLKPVIVLPPITLALGSKFSDRFCETYIYSIVRSANARRGIPFLNYLRDDRFTKDEFFFNSFFLNAKGREVFTQKVLKDLKLI